MGNDSEDRGRPLPSVSIHIRMNKQTAQFDWPIGSERTTISKIVNDIQLLFTKNKI